MLDYEKVRNWPFADEARSYAADDVRDILCGFGAGMLPALQHSDDCYAGAERGTPLPMIAVALADGEFWPMRPETGIDWRKIVHAAESVTQHRPLPLEGELLLTQRIQAIYDRGPDKGAQMVQEQVLRDPDGAPLVTIEVTTVLKGDGGCGAPPVPGKPPRTVPQDRLPDAVLDLPTPRGPEARFRISSELSVAGAGQSGQTMLRGVACFGLAGRAVTHLLCGGDASRVRCFGVRYAGPMFTDETVRLSLWYLENRSAAFRLTAVERDATILDHCLVEYS